MKFYFLKMKGSFEIIRAQPDHFPEIWNIYTLVSLGDKLLQNADLVTYENYAKAGGIIKMPSRDLIKHAIESDACIFYVAVYNRVVCGFVWGSIDFSPHDAFHKFFSLPGELTPNYKFYAAETDCGVITYGADLMMHPSFQKNIYSYLLFYSYLKTLLSKGKLMVIFMIESITYAFQQNTKHQLNLYNNASINFHEKLDARLIKKIKDIVDVTHEVKIERSCEFYWESVTHAFNVVEDRLRNTNIIMENPK